MGKFTDSGGKRRAFTLLTAFLLVISFLPLIAITTSEPVRAQTDGLDVNWHLIRDGIIHKVWEIDVQNLADTNRRIDLDTLFSDTSFPISELKNVEFYEWKALDDTHTFWFDNDNNPIYSTYEIILENGDNITLENEDNIIGYYRYSQVLPVKRCQWKPCKAQWFKLTAAIYKESMGEILLPAFGSEGDTDNFGNVYDENGIKKFKIEFDTPIQEREGGWGSSGKVAILLDNMEYHPWWDSNWPYRVPLTFNIGENVPPENYQYNIVLDKVDNLNSHCLDNFQDLRFTEDETIGELDFWFENYINGDNVVAWFERADNSLDDNTGYCYYGNASAGSAEDGDATFEFFDNFEDGDVSDWTSASAITADADSYKGNYALKMAPGGAHGVAYPTSNINLENFAIQARSKTTANNLFAVCLRLSDALNYYLGGLSGADTINFMKRVDGGFTHLGTSPDDVTVADNTWYKLEFRAFGTTIRITAWNEAGAEIAYIETTDDAFASEGVGVHSYLTALWDELFARKYVSPEPTASVGAEESSANPPEKPVLVSPENNYSTNDNTPTFTWTAGSGATSHRLVIDNDSTFSDGDNIYDNTNLGGSDTSCTIENELPPDNYWWKICATNADGDNWSENTWTFEITANTAPTTPTSLALTPDPCYITDDLVGAGSGSSDTDGDEITYHYAFYNETDSAMRQDWDADDSYTLVMALDVHDNIRVFVRAYDGYEYSDNLENSLIIADSLPTNATTILLSPDPIYVGNVLTATASGATDADDDMIYYLYRFYNDNESDTRQGYGIIDTYTIQQIDAHENIRVFVITGTITWGSSVAPYPDNSIIIGNIKPIAENQETDGETDPVDVASDTPVLSWDYYDNDADTQENFQIQVGTAADGSDMWDNNQQNSDSFITYAGAALTESITYYWRVRVYDNYVWSDWLSGGTFVITPNEAPDTPTIDSPADGYDATVGEGIGFSGSATDPDDDELTYEWDFGDGTETSDEADTTHTYSSPGHFTVTLTVTDPDGETSTITIIINVTSAEGPGSPGWVPPEEEPEEEPPPTVAGIPISATSIAAAWGVLLAVGFIWISSLGGSKNREWARNFAIWINPMMAFLTILFCVTQAIILAPALIVVWVWAFVLVEGVLFLCSLEKGPKRRRLTKQFIKWVLPTLAAITLILMWKGLI